MNTFEKEIEGKLMILPEKGKVLFIVLLCEKLYPYYVAFEKKYNWGSSDILANALSIVYEYLINPDVISIKDIKDTLSKVDMVTPDTDDFGSALSSFALNASTSISSTLKYLLDKKIDHITNVVSYVLDTIDLFIQQKEDMDTLDPSREIQIEYDDFMLEEEKRQRSLIYLLSESCLDKITDDLIGTLRDKNQIIDLSLLPD